MVTIGTGGSFTLRGQQGGGTGANLFIGDNDAVNAVAERTLAARFGTNGVALHVVTGGSTAFDGNAGTVTEMDALVAYLQILGRLTDAAHKQEVTGGIK